MTVHTFEPQRDIIDALKAHWRLYAFEGAVMIVLGVLDQERPTRPDGESRDGLEQEPITGSPDSIYHPGNPPI